MLTPRAARMPSGCQLLVGLDAERHLAAGADQDHLAARRPRRRPARRRPWPGPTPGRFRARSSVGSAWRVSTRQAGSCLSCSDHAPGLDDLVGVGRAEHDQARDRAQRRQLLDRLVGRAVLADADRVVREDVDRPEAPSDRRQADRRPHVVAEDQEACSRRAAASHSARPLTIAPMACSRTPKWRLRPP